jgi:hypothetical protein
MRPGPFTTAFSTTTINYISVYFNYDFLIIKAGFPSLFSEFVARKELESRRNGAMPSKQHHDAFRVDENNLPWTCWAWESFPPNKMVSIPNA